MLAGSLEIQLLANVARLQKDMDEAKRVVGGSASSIDQAAKKATESLGNLGGALKAVVASFGAAQLVGMVDQYTKFTAQLKLATDSVTEYGKAVSAVRRISKDAQSDISSTGVLFARITNATKELGFGQSKVIEITETVSLALKASGATAQESASAMLQLSQAFGSGVLRGQEFNAVNEAAPRLMRALADGIGVPVGQLRAMAEAGKLTSEVMANALPKALADLRLEAAQVQTIGGAFTVLKNNVIEFVGAQAQSSGAVSALTGAISTLAENLNLLASAAVGFGAAKLAQTLIGITSAAYGSVAAHQAKVAATLLAAQADAKATAATLAATAARVTELRASVLAAEGNVALAITTNGLIPAQARAAAAAAAHATALSSLTVAQRAASVSSAAMNAALGLLGGPIGLITTALGVAAAAWLYWGKSSEKANEQAQRSTEESGIQILASLEKQNAKLRERLALSRAGAVDAAKVGGPEVEKMAATLKQINDLKAKGSAITNVEQIALIELQGLYDDLSKAIGEKTSINAELAKSGQAATDLIEIRQRLMGVNKSYLDDLDKLQAALKVGAIGESEYVALVSKLATETYKKSAAGTVAAKSTKDVNKEDAEQAKLLAELSGLTSSFADDWDRLNKVYGKGVISLEQLTEAQAELLAKQPFFTKEQRAIEEATRSLLAVWDEEAKALAKVAEEYAEIVDAQDKATTSLASEVRAQREYNQRIGLTTDSIAALDAAKLQEQATAKDRLATLADEVDWTGALGDAYREQAASLRELAQLKSDGAFDQKQIDDFKSVWESVDKTAHDTFVNIFEGGKNAFEKLRDTLKATLLDLLYQMTVRKWVFNIAASVTGSSAGAVSSVGSAAGLLGGGGGGLLGTIQGGADILNTGGIAGMGYGIGNTAGTALANMTGTGIDGLLATNGAFGTAGGALGALGSALPWIGGALAIASLFGGGKRGGPKDTGSYGSGFLGAGFTRDDTQDQFNTGAANIVGGIGGSYAALTKALGINAGDLQSGAMFAIDNKGEGDALTQLMTQTYLNGKLVYDRNDANGGGNYEDVGRTPEELQAAISQASARAVLSALKASELPVALAGYFDSLDPLAMSAEQITAALDLAKAAQQFTAQIGFMGEGLSNLAGLSVKATTELAAAAGGMDALQSQFAAYYQAFYTEEERAAASLASVTDAMTGLGYSSVDTAAEFRALVESINPVDEESRSLLASLLSLAPAFATVHGAIDSLNAAAISYFAGVDGQAMALELFDDATSGIDKFLGTTVQSVADAQAAQANAAIDAAREAASLWSSAKSSIESALKDVRDLGSLISPSASRSKSLSAFDRATMAALGGDATAAASVGELAKSFLSASKSSSVDRLDYLRDRAMADAKLVSVLDKAKSQITLQEAIASASEATVSQLQIINQSLTGFGAQVYELLTKGYAGADRGTANDAAEKLAKATSDFAYFFNTAKEGDVVTGGQWGSSKVTRLAGDMASFTDSSGVVSYLRAADTIVGLGKQSPELRAIWEQQYGFKLPSYAVGTPFVPQDMIAQIHKGEAIMPAPVAQRWRDTGGGDSALMQEMLMETKAIRKNSDKTENRIYKLERILDDWDRNGAPVVNQPDTVLEVAP